jgi:hypothetical protein
MRRMRILPRAIMRHKTTARISSKMIVVAHDDDARFLSSRNANKEISL